MKYQPVIMVGILLIVAGVFFLYRFVPIGFISYREISADNQALAIDIFDQDQVATTSDENNQDEVFAEPPFVVTHVKTPDAVKAVYLTSWAGGHRKFREHLLDLVDNTEINSVVIDIKDYTGRISFDMDDDYIRSIGAIEKRIPDIKEFIGILHDRGVYVIGRISVFQDSYMVNIHPEWAVKKGDGTIWQDYKGVKWLDAGAKPVWDYIVAIGKASYDVGFDELNFDYIRYPSDGDLKDVVYEWGGGRNRAEVMRDFFEYLHSHFSSLGIPTSADLFGLTTSASDDLGIGQILELALPYFDFVAPMVYPSHFGSGYRGFVKPALYPYEVIKHAMDSAVAKAMATTTKNPTIGGEMIASTSPQLFVKSVHDKDKLRPWLQVFDLGAIYTPEMVRKQIQATYDVGLDSWMLWNPASVYNKDALLQKQNDVI